MLSSIEDAITFNIAWGDGRGERRELRAEPHAFCVP